MEPLDYGWRREQLAAFLKVSRLDSLIILSYRTHDRAVCVQLGASRRTP